jgi:hypothetical protein
MVSDIGFNNPTPPLTLSQTVGGTSGGVAANLSAVGYFGTSIFDIGGAHTGTASTTLNAAAGSSPSGLINGATPYSLTEVVTINVTALSGTSSKDFQVNADLSTVAVAVPEPASISLLGSALLLGVGAIRRKIRGA